MRTPLNLKQLIGKGFNYRFCALDPVSFGSVGSAALLDDDSVVIVPPSKKMLGGSNKDFREKYSRDLQAPFEFLWTKLSEDKGDRKEGAEEAWDFALKTWIPVLIEFKGKRMLVRPFSQLENCEEALNKIEKQ
jgi:hypothetical protein